MPGSVWDGFSPLRKRLPEANWFWKAVILLFFTLSGGVAGVLLLVFGFGLVPEEPDDPILRLYGAAAIAGAAAAFLWVLYLWRKMRRTPQGEDERVVWSIARDWVPPVAPVPGETPAAESQEEETPELESGSTTGVKGILSDVWKILSYGSYWPVVLVMMILNFLADAYFWDSAARAQTIPSRPLKKTGWLGDVLITVFVTACGAALCGTVAFLVSVCSGIHIADGPDLTLSSGAADTLAGRSKFHLAAWGAGGGLFTLGLCLYAFRWMKKLDTLADVPRRENPWRRYFGT